MKNIFTVARLLLVLFLASCQGKPSDNDIKKKILLEYICADGAKVNNLKIISTKDAQSFAGLKGFEYQVSGEMEWTNGCREFGAMLPPGHKEPFDNKQVVLIKGDDGNWH